MSCSRVKLACLALVLLPFLIIANMAASLTFQLSPEMGKCDSNTMLPSNQTGAEMGKRVSDTTLPSNQTIVEILGDVWNGFLDKYNQTNFNDRKQRLSLARFIPCRFPNSTLLVAALGDLIFITLACVCCGCCSDGKATKKQEKPKKNKERTSSGSNA